MCADCCVYIAGGRQGRLPVAAFEVYDFQTSRWRSLPDVPSKRVFALYAHSDTHIFSVGGLHQDAQQGFSDVTEVFDLDTGLYSSLHCTVSQNFRHPVLQTRLIQFEVNGFQRNIVHCTILTLLAVIPIMTYAPYRVLSVTSLTSVFADCMG